MWIGSHYPPENFYFFMWVIGGEWGPTFGFFKSLGEIGTRMLRNQKTHIQVIVIFAMNF